MVELKPATISPKKRPTLPGSVMTVNAINTSDANTTATPSITKYLMTSRSKVLTKSSILFDEVNCSC